VLSSLLSLLSQAWGANLKTQFRIKFVCIVASESVSPAGQHNTDLHSHATNCSPFVSTRQAINFVCSSHPDVMVHVGCIDKETDEKGDASRFAPATVPSRVCLRCVTTPSSADRCGRCATGKPLPPIMPGMGDIGDRMFGTGPDAATPLDEDDSMQDDS